MILPLTCEQCEELLPGYTLGALEPDESVAVAEHFGRCAHCPASLATYDMVLDRLGEAVPTSDPPAVVQQRLLASITQELSPQSSVPQQPSLPRWRVWTPRWALVLTAVNVLCFVGIAWWSWQLWQQAAGSPDRWQQVMHQLDVQRQALALITIPDSQRALLRGSQGQARGTLLLQSITPHAVLIVQDLPLLPSDRVYQLWLLRDSTRDNGGIFQVDAQGFGMLLIHAPHPLADYRAAGITEEPAGGSSGPTSPRLIGGRLQALEYTTP
jgi:hypothetical protein